jgi:ZIP family zinc transporter
MNTHVVRGLKPRKALGFLICGLGCVLLLSNLFRQMLASTPNLRAALIGGGTAAAATALGTLPVLLSQNFSKRTYDCFLGFGAGVLVGAGLLLVLDRVLTTDGILQPADNRSAHSLKRAWLFVWAVALHNMPEGLAIGVAYGGVDIGKANSLATGISIQDVPEGLVVALALRTVGYGRGLSTALGVASGLIEPVAAVAGVALIGVSAGLLPFALAAAAGAMLFVIANDVVPESHQNGHGTWASVALILGFILMTVLDTALG